MKALAALGATLLFSTVAASGTVYEGGSIGFRYEQFPFGSFSGTFFAEGDVSDYPSFPPIEPGACTGFFEQEAASELAAIGGVRNADQSADIAFVYVRSGAALGPGPYIVDPAGQSVIFGFLDDARGDFPADPQNADWGAWLDGLVAARKFVAVLGTVVITKVGSDAIEGVFDGLMYELSGGPLVVVSVASFTLERAAVSVDATSWGRIKSLYQH